MRVNASFGQMRFNAFFCQVRAAKIEFFPGTEFGCHDRAAEREHSEDAGGGGEMGGAQGHGQGSRAVREYLE